MSELYPDNLYLVDNNHINEIFKLINSSKKNISMYLPNGIRVSKEYNHLYFNKEEDIPSTFDIELNDGVMIGDYVFSFSETDKNTNNVIRLSSKDIKLPLRVRNRKTSDKMLVKNLNGSKKN